MIARTWSQRAIAVASLLIGCAGLAGCGVSDFTGPYPATTLSVTATPTVPGGWESVHITTSPVSRAVGDLVVDAGWIPVGGQEESLGKGGTTTVPVYPGPQPAVVVVRSNMHCHVGVPATDMLTTVGMPIDCGRAPQGSILDLLLRYPVDHATARDGAVKLWDASRCSTLTGCNGWSGTDGSNAMATIVAQPGSVVTWHEQLGG